jgi:hypothetical protein
MRSPLPDASWTLKGSVPSKLLAVDSYDHHVRNGVLQWVDTALRACPALYAGVPFPSAPVGRGVDGIDAMA